VPQLRAKIGGNLWIKPVGDQPRQAGAAAKPQPPRQRPGCAPCDDRRRRTRTPSDGWPILPPTMRNLMYWHNHDFYWYAPNRERKAHDYAMTMTTLTMTLTTKQHNFTVAGQCWRILEVVPAPLRSMSLAGMA
jgi:hypothetical protein